MHSEAAEVATYADAGSTGGGRESENLDAVGEFKLDMEPERLGGDVGDRTLSRIELLMVG